MGMDEMMIDPALINDHDWNGATRSFATPA